MAKLPIPFGNPTTYAGHSGIDYPVPRGTPIPASGPGRVTSRSRNDRGGFYIWVQYDAGPLVGYHHMDSHNGCPAVGARVNEGTRLGYVGNTGNSTGPHLHSEVAGHRTTDGYWKFFDRNRVVGSGSAAGGSSKPATKPATTPDESEEDEMRNCGVYYERSKNTWVYLVFNTGSGWYHEYSNGTNRGAMPSAYNNALAGALGTTSWAKVTASHAGVIKAGLDAVRRTAVSGSLAVDVTDA